MYEEYIILKNLDPMCYDWYLSRCDNDNMLYISSMKPYDDSWHLSQSGSYSILWMYTHLFNDINTDNPQKVSYYISLYELKITKEVTK